MATMNNSKRLLLLKRSAEVMTHDRDLWVVPRYEELHLINILALERQLSALESRMSATLGCEVHRNRGQACLPLCNPEIDLLPELQRMVKAYGNPADRFYKRQLM